jgi:hypothetical protein
VWFVLVVGVVVIAGWIFLANSNSVTRTGDNSMDDRLPANPYENPYDTNENNENNDRPFEPDGQACGESSSDDSHGAGDSDSSDCSSD